MMTVLPTLMMHIALLVKAVLAAAIIATPILLYKIYQLLRGRVQIRKESLFLYKSV